MFDEFILQFPLLHFVVGVALAEHWIAEVRCHSDTQRVMTDHPVLEVPLLVAACVVARVQAWKSQI